GLAREQLLDARLRGLAALVVRLDDQHAGGVAEEEQIVDRGGALPAGSEDDVVVLQGAKSLAGRRAKSSSAAASASAAPEPKAAALPQFCQMQPKARLAGNASSPTVRWNQPNHVPRCSVGASSATSAFSAPSV